VLLQRRSSWLDNVRNERAIYGLSCSPSSPNPSKITDHMTRSLIISWRLIARVPWICPRFRIHYCSSQGTYHRLRTLSISYNSPNFESFLHIIGWNPTVTRFRWTIYSPHCLSSFFSTWHDINLRYFSVITITHLLLNQVELSPCCAATPLMVPLVPLFGIKTHGHSRRFPGLVIWW
jgi:hypothetical protein